MLQKKKLNAKRNIVSEKVHTKYILHILHSKQVFLIISFVRVTPIPIIYFISLWHYVVQTVVTCAYKIMS